MEQKPMYSIGHGNRRAADFLTLLHQYDIEFLIDVRSKPYSKFHPQFNQRELKTFLEGNGITYVFMGDSIGGRPSDLTCYDTSGKVDYEILKTKFFFREGIERLKNAYYKNLKVALMCSESNPCECHRSKLIGKVLDTAKISLKHIDEKGSIKSQVAVIDRMNRGFAEFDLFGNPVNVSSGKSHI
jgi:uncharacterized protein (DUF488 family)